MKISIITATYNSAKTVRDTLESILGQTYKDIECIVVDGASKDNTLDVVKSYKPVFGDRMTYISERDKGLYDAMNKGIRLTTGDVIGILNSDDFFTSPTVIERMVKKMEETKADAVYGDVHYVSHKNLNKCVRYYTSRFFRKGLMRLGFMPAHPSFYCRAGIYKQYGTFDTSYKIAADFEQLLRLIYIHGISTVYLPMDFVTMRTGGISNAGMSSHRQIMQDHRLALRKNKVTSCYFLLSLRYIYKIGERFCSKFIRVGELPEYIRNR